MNQQDKSFLITFTVVMSVLVMIAIAIFLAAQMISVISIETTDDDGSRQKAVAEERIKPVAQVTIADPSEQVAAAATEQSAEEIYNSVCSACHAAGVLQAPKMGSKEEWEPRFVQGLDTLVNHAVNGIGAMPAKGGNPNLSEEDIRKTVVYMLEKSDIPIGETATAAAETPAAEAAAAAPAADVEGDLALGKEVYSAACAVCHEAGVAGAPKLGDKAAWEPRAAQGMQTLLDHAINGFKAMPAKGGNPTLSDADVRNAVAYMLSETGIEMGAAAAAAQEATSAPATTAESQPAEGASESAQAPEAQQGDISAPEAQAPATEEPMPASTSAEEAQPAAAEPVSAPATPLPSPEQNTPEAGAQESTPTVPEEQAPVDAQKETSTKLEQELPPGGNRVSEVTPEDLDLAHGKQLYNTACIVCHATGIAGAPRLGDRMAWASRLGQGWNKLVESSLERYKNGMAKHSHLDVPDEEIIAAVGYMVSKVQ